jgi:PKD repeat protein
MSTAAHAVKNSAAKPHPCIQKWIETIYPMKKTLPLILAPLFLWMLHGPIHASHIMGIEITHECLSSCTTRVHLKGYRDCTGVTTMTNVLSWVAPPGCTAPPAIGSASSQVIQEVTPICPSAVTSCTAPGSPLNGVEEYSWYRDWDICAGTPCTYTLEWSDCCRNPAITSLANAGGQGVVTSGSTINTALGTCNNSPQYTNLPLFYACAGQDYDVHQGAMDPDSDSLAYSLGTCYQNAGTPVSYAPGYSPTAPLGPTWNVTLDPETGMLHLDANPGNIVVGVMCIIVTEYRNGNVIGTTQRDIQIIILGCPSNTNPAYAALSNVTGAMAIGDDVYAVTGVPFCFDLGASDADVSQGIRLWWDSNTTSATFVDATNGSIQDTVSGAVGAPVTGRLCWTPATPGTYQFKFRAQDPFCPVYGFTEKIVTVHVGGCPGATAAATPVACPDVDFTASTCMSGTVTYTWSGSGGLSSTQQNPSHSYASPGTYAWQVIVTNGTQTDTVAGSVTVSTAPTPQTIFSGIHYVSPCTGALYDTLDAGGSWSSYVWSTGDTAQLLPVFIGGTYGVTVTAANGCTYNDAAQLYWSEPDIYGVVTTSTGAPLQNQRILLIQHDTTQQALWAVDSTWTDSVGYYFFCNVVDTLTFLKATPSAFYYPNEMPTYGDSSLYWNGATQLYGVLQAPFQFDFSTLYGTNPGGPGFIGGLITQGANKMNAIGDPIIGMRVFLRDYNTGAILAHRVTDANGYFVFGNVPLGDYEIVPDRPLVSTTNVPLLRIDAQTPVRDSLDFQLHRYWLELMDPMVGMPVPLPAFVCTVAPNPFAERSSLRLEVPEAGPVQIEVFDILGRNVELVASGVLARGRHAFAFGTALHSGVYFVRVASSSRVVTLKVVKE